MQLTELVGDCTEISLISSDLMLSFKVVQGSVDTANLAVRPALHTMASTQPLKSGNRDVHSLIDDRTNR